MKKLFTTILMLCVALVGWGQPSSGGLSIPETDGWDSSTGTLTVVYDSNAGSCTADNWNHLIKGPAEGIEHNVRTLILQGDFTNTDVYNITDNQNIIKKLLGDNNETTFYLNLKDCNNVTSDLTTTRTTVTREESISFSLYSSPVTFYDGNGNVVTNPDTNQQYNNGNGTTLKYVNGSWVADFGSYQAPLDEVRNLTFKDADGNVISNDVLKQGELTPNPNGTWTFIQRTKVGGALSFGNYKSKINGIYFPKNANFKYVPKDLCKEISSLQSITLPDNIIIIEDNAFQQCTSLGDFAFPKNIEEIGIDAFQKCYSLTTVDLRGLNSLWKIDAAAFDMTDSSKTNLVNIYLPVEDNTTLTFFGNWVFGSSKATKLDFSHCLGIKHFAYDGANYFDESIYTGQNAGSTKTFYWYDKLEEIILPPNLELVGEGCFQKCPALTTVEFLGVAQKVDGKLTNALVIGKEAFQDDAALTTIKFANNSNLFQINLGAFQRTGLTKADLSMCHELNVIAKDAFSTCQSLAEVKVCSHPKTIVGGQGGGAFYNCKAIRRVEVTACDGITDITQCKCECGAFDQDITYCGTNADFDQVEANAAILVFPDTAPIIKPEGVNEYYTSPFDFFVGDYKAGSLIVQEGLEGYHKDVPNSGYGTYKYKDKNGQDVWTSVTCNYQINDGWHEFIKTEVGQIITPEPSGEFLRTYSRSIGAGPCILPKEITAYRAVDYKTKERAYIKDKNGNYYCQDESVAEENRVYIKITSETPESDYAGKNRYSYLMVGGQVYLRKLVAWQANLTDTNGNAIPYDTKAHKQFYDDLIYNKENPSYADKDMPMCINLSYVPENTGVVLYSYGLDEKYLLVLGGDFSGDYVLPEYKHTQKRYEEDRENTEPDNINMLQGTFDVKTLVSPVFPWFGQNEETGKGGSYNDNIEPRAYRNFIFNKPNRMWLRVKAGIAPNNFAFASIPVERFDNFNEGLNDPKFVIQDLNGADESAPANTMLISMFEDNSESIVDGIHTVNTISTNADSNAWYTLQGVRVAQPVKGVYIHNGKKVVVK